MRLRSVRLRSASHPRHRLGLRAWRLAALLMALLACGAVASALLIRSRTAVPGWSERAPAREPQTITLAQIQQRFALAKSGLGREDYRMLALHLLEGWSLYRSPEGARAHYPGLPSDAGRAADGMEGFSRMAPLAAVMLVRGEDPRVSHDLLLSGALRAGLLAGTAQTHPARWGPVRAYSPQYVEAADIALALWLGRAALWEPLSVDEKAQVARWLSESLAHLPHDGNWMVFPLLVHRSLQALGVDVSRFDARMQTHWERLLHLHRGRGWFHDPPHGFDYYNAWGIHTAFYWLRRIDPSFGGSFVSEIQGEFASFLRHLISPHGHPPLGRSTCYRMALSAPLLGSLRVAPGALPPGQAVRALDLSWGWFIGHGALQAGAVTAGLCQADPALQSHYSGPASCLWALRSLTIALDLDHLSGLLDAPREPLPVEQEAFVLHHAITGWRVQGDLATGHVSLYPNGAQPAQTPLRLQEYSPGRRSLEWLLHKPGRPDNRAALYERSRYGTDDDIAQRCAQATAPTGHLLRSTVDR